MINKRENKTIKKLVRITPKMLEMMEEIKDRKGYISISAVICQGIIELHKAYFPAYAQKDNTPHGKAERKRAEEDARKQIERDNLLDIVEVLGGKIVDKNGTDYCEYFTYQNKKRYEQSIPLDQLTEDLPKNQYSPDKAKVLRFQKEGKTDYEVK